jgi:hypothetical protein
MNFRATARSLALALPLLLSGCIEMEQELTIGNEGSGTMKSHVAMTEKNLEKIENMAKAMGGGEENASPADAFDEKRIRDEAKKKKVDLQSYKTWTADEKKHVEMVVGFKNLEDLRNASLGGNDESDIFFLKGDQDGTARLVLYPQGMEKHKEEVARMKEMAAAGDEAMAMQRAMLGRMKAELKGLKFVYRIKVPGKIASVGEGLKQADDNTAVFTFSDEDVKGPEDMQRLGTMKFEIVFDGASLKIPLDKEEKPASRKAKTDEGDSMKEPAKQPAGREKSGDR